MAARIHQQLKLAGQDAWFDKVNIPDGDDYQQRINHGIESAHNFVCIMAPRGLTSPYCLVELEYARLLGKLVIPLNHMVIFKTPEQSLSAGDQQVLVTFYQFHNQPDQNIRTTQDVLNRSHALIGKTNWLDAKQKLSDEDIKNIAQWAQSYENNWAKHEDLDYLQQVDFPEFGESIDTLDSVVERITAVLERQTAYVRMHTEILADALHWQKNQKATQHLLVGQQRTAAEEWLLTEFIPPEQPPCQPSALVCEFICEARKNADNFIFFISADSVASEHCQRGLAYALQYNKRIVPLLIIAPTPTSDIPDVLRVLQYVDFTDNTCHADYDSDIDDILNILKHDYEYYKRHALNLTQLIKPQKLRRRPGLNKEKSLLNKEKSNKLWLSLLTHFKSILVWCLSQKTMREHWHKRPNNYEDCILERINTYNDRDCI
ncbi:MAG: hypothetical protein DRR19_02530 [Candidatus Parabeggiatoa sp. nov. 1]|nr:MAG: hypothetical protein DRR19_02530 [Gammaproteobacteria bacterium]